MISKILSIGLGLALASSIGLLGKIGCDNMKLSERTSQLNEKLMQADLDKGRAETQFGEAKRYIGELESAITEEIKQREAEITRYGELEASFERLKKKKTKTKIVYRNQSVIKNKKLNLRPGGLYQAVGKHSLRELSELSGWMEDRILRIDARVLTELSDKQIYPFEFKYKLNLRLHLKLVETLTSSGAINHYAELSAVDKSGKKIQKLKLDRFQMVVQHPNTTQWFWWAPHLDVGAFGGISVSPTREPQFAPGGSIGISFMGHGLTKNDLEWRVLRLSFDFVRDQPAIGFTPVLWNAGKVLPLVSNIWIGPHVVWLPPEDWAFGLFIGAVL